MRSALRRLCRVSGSGSGAGAGAPDGRADASRVTSMAVIGQIVLCWYRASGALNRRALARESDVGVGGRSGAAGMAMKAERPDSCRLAAWLALLDAHRRLTSRLEADLERSHGLSLAEYEVLCRLEDAPGQRLRLHELTAHTRMTKSGVSRLVDRMQSSGLLRTERCPSDRRGAFAVLTADGSAVFARAASIHLRGIQDHFGRHLGDDEAAAVRAALERVRDALPGPGCRPAAAGSTPAVSG